MVAILGRVPNYGSHFVTVSTIFLCSCFQILDTVMHILVVYYIGGDLSTYLILPLNQWKLALALVGLWPVERSFPCHFSSNEASFFTYLNRKKTKKYKLDIDRIS